SGTVITVDNTTGGRFRASSNWEVSSWASGRVGANYRFRRPAERSDLAEYKINIPTAGRYEVFARVPGNGYNTNQPYFIHHRGGRTNVHRNISGRGASWVSLGTYTFDARDDWIVQLSCWTNGDGYVIADAIRFERR
ncbi:amidase, partial [Myxococcota bacterium]|nr:amidase [Myxococcota bacterium]